MPFRVQVQESGRGTVPCRMEPPDDPPFRRRAAVPLGIVFMLLPLATLTARASAASDAAGFQPHQAYENGLSERINLYNLNLVVSTPLSATYPVSERFSYGLKAYYNGALQWSSDGISSGYGRSLANPDLHGWLGAGWRLDFGKVIHYPYPEGGPCSRIGSVWVTPGGGRHPINDNDYGSTLDGTDMWVQASMPMPSPDDGCRVPTELHSREDRLYRTIDPETGQVVRISEGSASPHALDIEYMEPADFDPSGSLDPASYMYESPFPEIKERILAIKRLRDSHGREITTTLSRPLLAEGIDRFLLTSLQVPVFGDAPGNATGTWQLAYEARTIGAPPPGWPDDGSFVPITLPFLVSVTDPEGRVTWFDYDDYGEMVDIWHPSAARTEYAWGDELISPGDDPIPSGHPVRRVVRERTFWPYVGWTVWTTEPLWGMGLQPNRWLYQHDRIPQDSFLSSCPVHDPWRAIVTDPAGNDTVHRFYSATLTPLERGTYAPPALPGAVKFYKGSARRWTPGAGSFLHDVDPDYPGDGELIRAVYYRYQKWDPVLQADTRLHVRGVQTVYYDDKLDPAPSIWDPAQPDTRCQLNHEMEAVLDPAAPGAPAGIEGWATHMMLHDPNTFFMVQGSSEFTRIHRGNLVGPREIREEGDPDHCTAHGPFQHRSVYFGGGAVEYSQEYLGACRRRLDPLVDSPRDPLVSRTRTVTESVRIRYSGGDPVLPDPGAPGDSGVSYEEVLAYQHGVLSGRKWDGVDWYVTDRTIDWATGLPASSRDPAGIETRYTYDRIGRLTSVARPAPELPVHIRYNRLGWEMTNRSGSMVPYGCSFSFQVWRGDDAAIPSDDVTEYFMDGRGLVHKILKGRFTDYENRRFQYRLYDSFGALLWTTSWVHVPARDLPRTSYSYHEGDPDQSPPGPRDPFSRPLRITEPDGAWTVFSYFGLNRTATRGNLNEDPTDPDPGPLVSTTTYHDFRGNVRIVVAPEGAHEIHERDHAGRIENLRLVSGFTWRGYADGPGGEPGTGRDRFSVEIDPARLLQERRFSRDGAGHLRESAEPEKGTTLFHAYDPAGRLTLSEDARGMLRRMSRNSAGRLAQLEAGPGMGTLRLVRRFHFADLESEVAGHGSALGRLIRAESYESGVLEPVSVRELDHAGLNGRLSEERVRYGFMEQPGSDSWIRTLHTYNLSGDRNLVEYPLEDRSGRTRTRLGFSYWPDGSWRGLTVNRFDDPLTGGTRNEYIVDNAAYTAGGQLRELAFHNGIIESRGYDDLGRPLEQSLSGPAGTIWSDGIFTYDGTGNLTGAGPQTFLYDAVGRLRASSTGSMDPVQVLHGQSFDYDLLGSMTRRTGYAGLPGSAGLQEFTVDSSTNRLLAINPDGANLRFSYSATGQVTSDGIYDYEYDELDQLVHLRPKGSGRILESYAYDDRGWRIRSDSVPAARTTAYFRDSDGSLLSEYSAPRGAPGEFVWRKDYLHAGGRQIAAVENLPPGSPGGITSSASRAGESPWVALAWQASAEPDQAGYHVYRAGSPAGSFDRLTAEPLRSPEFTDRSLAEGASSYYRLTAVDDAGVESPRTTARKITAGDQDPPGSVEDLSGSYREQDGVELTWKAGSGDTAGDLAGYLVYRRSDPIAPWLLLSGPLGPSSGSFLDISTEPGSTYSYEVRAFDTAGLESAANPAVDVVHPPAGSGSGKGCTGRCLPGREASLLLGPCDFPGSARQRPEQVAGRCSGDAGWSEALASPGAGDPAWRIVYFHVDHLGSIRLLTDEAGQVISRHAFFPFGEEVPGPDSTALSSNTHWFTGKERNDALGIDSMLARDYLPRTARFRSPDPFSLVYPAAGASSAYGYVHGRPLSMVDVKGEKASTVWCTAAATADATSILGGTLTLVFAVAPEPIFTKGAAAAIFGITTFAAGSVVTLHDKCSEARRMEAVQAKVDDCAASGTRQTCREAEALCERDQQEERHELRHCEEVKKRLSELDETNPADPFEPCPSPLGGAVPASACPTIQPALPAVP